MPLTLFSCSDFFTNFIIIIGIIYLCTYLFFRKIREEKIASRTMWWNHCLILKQKKNFFWLQDDVVK